MSRFRSLFVLLGLLAAVHPAPAQTPRVFFGNLHSHTAYSDGSGTPEQAYRHARDEARLHFLAVTEHNHRRAESSAGDRRDGLLIARHPDLYEGPQSDGLVPTARRFTEDGRFVALYGQEFSSISSGNHVNVFEVAKVIHEQEVPNGRFDLLLDWLGRHPDSSGEPAVLQFNHPALMDEEALEYGADDFPSREEWMRKVGRHASLIEVVNGPAMTRGSGERPAEVMEADYLHYLNLGFLLAPTADQDNHYRTWGSATEARTAVVAPRLTRKDLLDALRARHVYASEDRNLELVFRVDGHLAGDVVERLPAPGSALRIEYTVHDPDEPEAAYEVAVLSDDGPGGEPAREVDAFTARGNTAPGAPHVINELRYRGPGQYVLFRVRQLGEDGPGDRAWIAPVWFGTGGGAPAGAAVRIVSLLPNPAGDEREREEVTLRNLGSTPVSLDGWTVRDAAGKSWSLAGLGTLAPGEEKTLRRGGQPMGLNNGGDTVALLAHDGTMVQSVTYTAADEGRRVRVEP